jgi:DNA-binding response OmpR family regulator
MDLELALEDIAGEADLDRLAHAVEALVEAIAPGVVSQVRLVGQRVPARGGRSLAAVPDPAPSRRNGPADVTVDAHARVLLVDGEPVGLTRREFELMAHIDARRGVALSRDDLMRAVWHQPYVPGDRTVDVHVRRLRVKLGRHADRLATLRGFGYRFD